MTSAQVDDRPKRLAYDNRNWLRELRRARYTTSKTAPRIQNPSPRQPRMAVASRERPREQKKQRRARFSPGPKLAQPPTVRRISGLARRNRSYFREQRRARHNISKAISSPHRARKKIISRQRKISTTLALLFLRVAPRADNGFHSNGRSERRPAGQRADADIATTMPVIHSLTAQRLRLWQRSTPHLRISEMPRPSST